MKKITLIACLIFPALLAAQDASAPDSSTSAFVTKIVRVEYGNPATIAAMAGSNMGIHYSSDDSLRAIVLKGPPSAVASVEHIIHQLDAPSSAPNAKDIELTVSVIGTSAKGSPSGQEVPPGLLPTVKQLSAIFPYKNYQLLSSMLMRSREGGKTESHGVMQSVSGGTENPYLSPYRVAYDDVTVSSMDGKPSIHLKKFNFSTTVRIRIEPGSSAYQNSEVGLTTDVDLREGEKVVVGKANTETSESALFVVLSARLAD
ncbi:MAG: hypothetical protein JO270_09460 [Acidobacteriaceae bacterium]|nr:hypothetical protein [Acidobacteriaceae bacterium]